MTEPRAVDRIGCLLKVYYVTCSVWGFPLEARGGGGFKLGVSSGILLNYLLPMPVEIPITLPNLKHRRSRSRGKGAKGGAKRVVEEA